MNDIIFRIRFSFLKVNYYFYCILNLNFLISIISYILIPIISMNKYHMIEYKNIMNTLRQLRITCLYLGARF